MRAMRTSSLALLTVIAASTLAACAGDKGEVNYVQPGYVTKAELLGKSWYYRRTVIDTPEGDQDLGYATVGSGDIYTMERIKFDIQEDYLIAYRDYEYIPGSEGVAPEDTKYLGGPVVAFPITDHFDIVHRYNPSTGEQTNVTEENTTDREWFDREFMRVDWAHTELSSQDYYLIAVDYLDNDGRDGGELYYHENDATNPWRARITPTSGYFDFVVLHRLQPDYYACYYAYDNIGCGSGEVRVRHSFMEIDPSLNANYDPLYYPDSLPVVDDSGHEVPDPVSGEVLRENIFDRFGYYRLEKLTYDDERGLTESGRLYRIMRMDIWDKSVDENGGVIPYADRSVRPIIYYLNYDFPDDLKDAAQTVGSQWNDAFRETIAALQGKPASAVGTAFEIRENDCSQANVGAYLDAHKDVRTKVRDSVKAELDADTLDNYCAAAEYYSNGDFKWEQVGDPRYNMLVWMNEVLQTGWSGYGPMLADPVSGRIMVSTSFISGWTIENAATRGLQYIDYMNGVTSLSDLLIGADVPSLVNATTTTYDAGRQTGTVDSAQARAIEHRASPAHVASLENRFAVAESAKPLLTPLDNPSYFDERLSRVQDTSIEKDWLVRVEDLMVAGNGSFKRGDPATDQLYHDASVITRTRDGVEQMRYQEQLFSEHMFCNLDAALDDGLVGLAKELKDLPRNERRGKIRERVFTAVALHEIGHNIGLRHNFQGSYDALNYNRTFWDLESSGADEQTKLEAKQPEYKYSSIMDYHGKVNTDFAGLGLYDKAAVKFGYGQLVETFKGAAAAGGPALQNFREANDYRKLPQHLGSIEAMYDRGTRNWDWRDPAQRSPSALSSLHDVEVPYMFCSDEFAGWMPTCRRFDFGASAGEQVEASYVRYKNYFLFNNYLRNRLQLNTRAIINRGYSIYYDVLNTYQYMVLYRSRDPNFFNTDRGVDMASAVGRGLNAMAELIATPEPATYYSCTDGVNTMYYPTGFIIYDPIIDVDHGRGPNGETCAMTSPSALGLGDSQPLFLGFTEDYVDWTFSFLGTYWDKENAIFLLTQPSVRYVRVNGAEDFRNYSVSLFRVYRPEVLGLLEGLIRYDYGQIASRITDNGGTATLSPLNVVDPNAPLSDVGYLPGGGPGSPPGSQNVLPSVARNLQRESLLFGLARLSSPLDQELDFGKYSRVWVRGAVDDLFSDADWAAFAAGDKAECQPESSNVTYRALRAADGVGAGLHDIGWQLVTDCANRKQRLIDAQADLATAITGGDPRTIDDAQRQVDIADINLGAASQMLQYVRLVHSLFEHGVEL
jgi:hypothetical protein